jgi:hypothetical protein
MTTIGLNLKITVSPEARGPLREMFQEVLGAERIQPLPELDVFLLEGGARVGAYYDEAALPPEAARLGAWIELVVDAPDATAAALVERGVARVEYHDRAHAYFQAPGGLVFRLAGR